MTTQTRWQWAKRETRRRRKGLQYEHTTDRVATGVGSSTAAVRREGKGFFEPGCSAGPSTPAAAALGADQVSHLAHLNARDTTLLGLTGDAGGHRASERADGLEDALVHHH
jgi:hypothetical protein